MKPCLARSYWCHGDGPASGFGHHTEPRAWLTLGRDSTLFGNEFREGESRRNPGSAQCLSEALNIASGAFAEPFCVAVVFAGAHRICFRKTRREINDLCRFDAACLRVRLANLQPVYQRTRNISGTQDRRIRRGRAQPRFHTRGLADFLSLIVRGGRWPPSCPAFRDERRLS